MSWVLFNIAIGIEIDIDELREGVIELLDEETNDGSFGRLLGAVIGVDVGNRKSSWVDRDQGNF